MICFFVDDRIALGVNAFIHQSTLVTFSRFRCAAAILQRTYDHWPVMTITDILSATVMLCDMCPERSRSLDGTSCPAPYHDDGRLV